MSIALIPPPVVEENAPVRSTMLYIHIFGLANRNKTLNKLTVNPRYNKELLVRFIDKLSINKEIRLETSKNITLDSEKLLFSFNENNFCF